MITILKAEDFVVMPDPDAKYPTGAKRHTVVKKNGIKKCDVKTDDKEFQEDIKHMGKCTTLYTK